jgi:hypothetical protein
MAVVYASDRASNARQVKGDDPDKNGYPSPPVRGLGVGPSTPPRTEASRNLKELKLDEHLGNDMRQYTKAGDRGQAIN